MRVALSKVDGVTSVDVTLKRGVAHIGLLEGNRVTLTALRRIVKDAGYTSGDAAVTAVGHVVSKAGARQFVVEGTNEIFRLEADAREPAAQPGTPAPQSGLVEVAGTATPPASGTKLPETLRVRTMTARQ